MIFIYIGIAQRGTTSEIAPYRPFFDTVVFPDGTPDDEIRDSVRERMRRTAEGFGWSNFYSFITQEVPAKHIAYFADDVLKWERERTKKYPEYQIVCYVTVKGRSAPEMICGKVFRDQQECQEAVTELNEIARRNGVEFAYYVRRIND